MKLPVSHADEFDRRGPALRQDLGDARTHAAEDLMLLDCYDGAAAFRRRYDRVRASVRRYFSSVMARGESGGSNT